MSWFSGKKRVLNFIFPLILALVFFSLTSQRARRATWYESALLNIVSPLQWAATSVWDSAGSVWNSYIWLVGISDENRKLRKENASLKGQIIRMEEVKRENERLRSLLNYKSATPYPTVVGRVIANDPRAEFKSITIDKGSKDGLEVLMPVIGPKGLVGRIGRLSSHMAQVLLITDPNSAVDVIVQRSRARALLVGTAKKTELKTAYYISRLEYLRRVSDVKDEDVVVTSGFDQIYPPGIPVGTIHNVVGSNYGVFKSADVAPFEDFAELGEVIVLLKSNQ
jgi:rod shape-determining protein MreC